MKKLLYMFILLPTIVSAQQITWSEPVVVNGNTTLGYSRPRIALTADNKPVVAWGKSSNMDVYVAKMVDTSFGNPVKVTPDGVTAFIQNWAGPSLSASDNSVFVSFKSQPEDAGFVYVVKSVDGGLTFGDTVRVSNENWSRFSEVSVGPDGNPVVAYMQFDPSFTDPRWVVSRSVDGGQSFNTPVIGAAMAPGEACDCCPGFILAEQDRTILMFRNNDNDLRDMWAAISTNDGNTFPAGKDIDNNNWMIGSCPSSGPDAIISGDSLVAVWMSGASGYSRVNIGTSDLSTLTIGLNEEIEPTTTTNQNFPRIAGEDNTMGVVWQESGLGKADINFVWSGTGAATLAQATPLAINTSSTGSRMNPDIAYKDGVFHIVWQDNEARQVIYRQGTIDGASVKEVVLPNSLRIYPNPANERLTVRLPFELMNKQNELVIYNTVGETVYTIKDVNADRLVVDIGGFTSGVYLLKFHSKGESYTGRFVVE